MTESLSNEVGLTCVQVMFPELNCSRGAAGQSKSSWTLDDQAHRVTVAAGWVPGAKGAGTSPADACCSLRRAAGLCWHSRAVLGWSSCRSRLLKFAGRDQCTPLPPVQPLLPYTQAQPELDLWTERCNVVLNRISPHHGAEPWQTRAVPP